MHEHVQPRREGHRSAKFSRATSTRAATPAREKIAVLGGGMGAIAAAFALTEVDGWQDRYEITVYQMGWRLGGKGASGRDMHRPERRVEEHGLHAWFGFYENAFRLMRRCYEELPELRDWPASVDPIRWGFEPHDEAMIEECIGGVWKHHAISFPRNDAWPGVEGQPALTPAYAVRMLLAWMWRTLAASPLGSADPAAVPPDASEWRRVLARLAERSLDAAAEALGGAAGMGRAVPPEVAALVGVTADRLLRLLDRLTGWLWERLGGLVADHDAARRLWVAVDFGAAVVRGLLVENVAWRGFDAIDDINPRDWLRRHGASDLTLDSDWARVLYAQSFAFLNGDPRTPSVAAGPAVRCALRMLLTYRGAFTFKLRSGMGDIVFAPFYRVLAARGVRFAFFHRVRQLHLTADRRAIERISIGRQAMPRTGSYEPLVRVNDLWCWPNEPDYRQLREERDIRALQAKPGAYVNLESVWSSWGPERETLVELRRGADFDRVVLGISLGALPPICEELIAARRRWRRMVERIPTIRTQAFQVWMRPTLAETGWRGPSPLSTAYARPMETWGDLSLLLATESWKPGQRPGMLAYVCGPMPDGEGEPPAWFSDPTYPGRERERAFAEMRRFLCEHGGHLWPALRRHGDFDWAQLVDAEGRAGAERLRAQFWIANVEPSERYVLSVPGSLRHRLRSDESGFDNLYLAGDWTFTGMNLGCVEGAVMSGLRAARAISGAPIPIVGEDG